MQTKKIDLIQGAYSQMRISGLTVNPTPEDGQLALWRLEAMMAELAENRNICFGYNFEDSPDLNSLSWTKKADDHCIQTNLAIRLIPDFNKEVPSTLMMQATQSLSGKSGKTAKDRLQQVNYPDRMALGEANTLRYRPYNRFYRELSPPPNECATNFIYIDDINDYTEDYTSFLRDGETVSAYTIEADEGLSIQSDSLSSPVISYRVKGISAQTSGNWQQVKIQITTSLGRVNTRLINFDVQKADTVGTL